MPTPTTVLEFAQATHDAHELAKSAAQSELSLAQGALASARTALDAATAALKEKQKQIEVKRAEIAKADTPAEASTLAAELSGLVAEQRVLQAELLDAREAVTAASDAATRAAGVLARTRVRLVLAETELASAASAHATREEVKAAATAAPLDTLAGEADDALTQELYTTARDRVTEAIPTALLDAARRGYEVEVARVASVKAARRAAEDLLLAEVESGRGVEGLVLRRTVELARAESDLRTWTDGARGRYDRALANLRSVNAGDSLLSPPELDGVHALDEEAGQNAAGTRVNLLTAREAVQDAQIALETATMAALAPDPTADVSGEADVSAAQGVLDGATGNLTGAQTAHDDNEAAFVAWTAEVPDGAWRKLLAYIEADVLLLNLAAIDTSDVTDLVDAVTEAEENLAEALDAAEAHARSVAFLEGYVALATDRLTGAEATLPDRLLGAVRGDD